MTKETPPQRAVTVEQRDKDIALQCWDAFDDGEGLPYLEKAFAAHRLQALVQQSAATGGEGPYLSQADAWNDALEKSAEIVERYNASFEDPECGGAPDDIRALKRPTTPSNPPAPSDGVRAHFERMQDMARRYIEPQDYVVSYPTDGSEWKTTFRDVSNEDLTNPYNGGAIQASERRKEAFINDMIYALDGPEQRTISSNPAGSDEVLREQVARVLWERWAPEHEVEWDDVPGGVQSEYREVARAVLSITNPTGEGGVRTSALEEAARVADGYATDNDKPYATLVTAPVATQMRYEGHHYAGKNIAKRIRALSANGGGAG